MYMFMKQIAWGNWDNRKPATIGGHRLKLCGVACCCIQAEFFVCLFAQDMMEPWFSIGQFVCFIHLL